MVIPTTMSFVFRGTRADIESGIPEFIPQRPVVVRFLSCVFVSHCTVLLNVQ